MNKIDCIEDYFTGLMVYYWFHFDRNEHILDKKYLNAAKVAFASNIMLSIKEDLVETKGAMNYQSKAFLNALESSVSSIATKDEGGYKLSNYTFPDATSLVAIIRNKLAHGKYTIDFNHNRVIFEHKGKDIIVNIEKLVAFIIRAFGLTLKDLKKTTYVRNIGYNIKRTDEITNGRINGVDDIRKIIKSYNYASFKIESLNGMPVFRDCIDVFDGFLKVFRANPYTAMKSSQYKELLEYLKKRNCKLTVEYGKLHDSEKIDRIVSFIDKNIINNKNFTYEQQVKAIGIEVQRCMDEQYNDFSPILACANNIMLLDAITRTHSVNREVISSYVGNAYDYELPFSYEEFGTVLLGKFTSLFMYPFDDIFETSGEYKIDRPTAFDFSLLDLSMVNPDVLNIDEAPLDNALDRRNSLYSKHEQLSRKIEDQKNNLQKVKGNQVAEQKINDSITDLTKSLGLLFTEYLSADSEYNSIKNDYTVNKLYFRNRAIIEGIRNAIAHGNYQFVVNGNLADSIVIFSDVYEGKTTFQVKMTFQQFDDLINENYTSVLEYIRNKRKKYEKTLCKK